MAQSGWRLSPELLKRVRVRAAEEGVRQNAWVERALESALGDDRAPVPAPEGKPDPRGRASAPAPSRAPVKPSAVPGVKTAREVALERQAALNKAKGS